MSSVRQIPIPAITRSKNTKTPARTSVTPVRSVALCAVGVEPTLTTGHGSPASRRMLAARTTPARSASAHCRTTPEGATDLDEARPVGREHARTMAVTIYLDQSGNTQSRPKRSRCDLFRLLDGVEHDGEVDTLGTQFENPRELRRRDADGVDD